MTYISEDLWRIILENGVRNSNFTAKDLCSFAQTCKLFLQVGNEDSIWSPLLAADVNKEEPYWPKADLSFSASAKTRVLLRRAMNTYVKRMLEEIPTQQEKEMLAIQEGSVEDELSELDLVEMNNLVDLDFLD
ncbi:hypothetical protein ACFE04_026903 [Oxalis oulophora]